MPYQHGEVVGLTFGADDSEDTDEDLPPVEEYIKSPHRLRLPLEQTPAVRHVAHNSHSHPGPPTAGLRGGAGTSLSPYTPNKTSTSPKRSTNGQFTREPASTKTLKHKRSVDSNRLKSTGHNGRREETQAEKRRRLHPPKKRSPERQNPEGGNWRHGSKIEGDNGWGDDLPYGGQNALVITSTADVGGRGLEFVAPVAMQSDWMKEFNQHETKSQRAVHGSGLSSTESLDSDDATDALQAFKPRPDRSTKETMGRLHEIKNPTGPVPLGSPGSGPGNHSSEDDDPSQDADIILQRPRGTLNLGSSVLASHGKPKVREGGAVSPRPPANIGRHRHNPTHTNNTIESIFKPFTDPSVDDLETVASVSDNDGSFLKLKGDVPSTVPNNFTPNALEGGTNARTTLYKKQGQGVLWTEEEDRKIIELKKKQLSWPEVAKYLHQRTPGATATRYSTMRYSKKLAAKYGLTPSHDAVDRLLPGRTSGRASVSHEDINHVSESVYSPVDFADVPDSQDSVFGGTPHYLPADLNGVQSPEDSVLGGTPEPTSKHQNGRPRGRPRRVIQKISYAPQKGLKAPRVSEMSVSADTPVSASPSRSRLGHTPAYSEDVDLEIPSVEVIGLPNQVDHIKEAAVIATATSMTSNAFENRNDEKYPYLGASDRQAVRQGLSNGDWDPRLSGHWPGTVVHVDFQFEEMEVMENAIRKSLGIPDITKRKLLSIRKRIQKMLVNVPENKIHEISWEARRGRRLGTRSRESVVAFLMDAAAGLIEAFPRIERLGNIRPNRIRSSASSILRQRELGLDSTKRWSNSHDPGSNEMRQRMFDTFGAAYSFTGMSNDVLSVAWHPDGQRFAAGAACVVDEDSMQYNRPNNLLLGDTTSKTLRELPDHYVTREKAEQGVNSSHSMHVSQDPRLFTTISMVEFSQDGCFMFSAGYDNHVRVYADYQDMNLEYALKHKAPVDLLATSKNGLLATACQRAEKPIKVIHFDSVDLDNDSLDPGPQVWSSFQSQKARERADLRILPKALRFEPTLGEYLLAGFGANASEDGVDTVGEICLWDVSTQQRLEIWGGNRNVFDLAFNPCCRAGGIFAVGCVAGANANRGAHSVVRFYDLRLNSKYSTFMELECPAKDMNDVVYCPHDDVYFAAGCTDGKTYVWDIRYPDNWLYTLSHGESLMPLDSNQPRELLDTGIRFCSWGDSSRRLYTGSSDGVVKVWDITHATTDVFVNDLVSLNSGVMSGAFSQDKTSLLIGEVNGSVNVLELGREDCSIKDMEPLRFIPVAEPSKSSQANHSGLDPDSGVAIGKKLVRSRQIEIAPFGGLPIRQAVQGPMYSGPYDESETAEQLREESSFFQQDLRSYMDVPQCDIAACIHDIAKLTLEEAGDSGRSKDRIPDSLRQAWLDVGSNLVVPGRSKCSNCGRPARPSLGDNAEALCERCGFACFNCGSSAVVTPATNLVSCLSCGRKWDVGVLGYEPLYSGRGQKMEGIEKEMVSLTANDDSDDATLGDEDNDLAWHYHSRWTDRPPSPI